MTPDALLAYITKELNQISVDQHALARRREVLRQMATRLRLGASVTEVRAVIGGAV